MSRLLVLMTTSPERRFDLYEDLNWWDFIKAKEHSEAYQTYLADRLSRSLVAVQPKHLSTRTGGYILLQFLYDFSEGQVALDRVLNAPTNDAWLDPWLTYLQENNTNKVDYQKGIKVVAIHCTKNRITSVTVSDACGNREVNADYYIAALPVDIMIPLVTKEMTDADPQLGKIANLKTAWMNGIMFYLKLRTSRSCGARTTATLPADVHLTAPSSGRNL